MRLQVNRQNYTAINFYFKLGFTIERVADFDIGHGFFMNDFVMLKQLS
jgi:ribosomal protein S18 acetylase RimI-like enzyme